jgi:ankyrin repeat protein
MLDYGADVNATDASGDVPLHEAIRQGRTGLVKDLVARGADVNARTQGGDAGPLEAAAAGAE